MATQPFLHGILTEYEDDLSTFISDCDDTKYGGMDKTRHHLRRLSLLGTIYTPLKVEVFTHGNYGGLHFKGPYCQSLVNEKLSTKAFRSVCQTMQFSIHKITTSVADEEAKDRVLAEMLALSPDPDLNRSGKGSDDHRTTELKVLGKKKALTMAGPRLSTDSVPPSDMNLLIDNVMDSRHSNNGDRYRNTSSILKEGSLCRQLDVPINDCSDSIGLTTQRLHKTSVIWSGGAVIINRFPDHGRFKWHASYAF